MEEKSGMDILEQILSKLDLLDKKVDVLDMAVKKIANSVKLSELVTKSADKSLNVWQGVADDSVKDVKAEIEKLKNKYAGKFNNMSAGVGAGAGSTMAPMITQALMPGADIDKELEKRAQDFLKNNPKVGPKGAFVKGDVLVSLENGNTVKVGLANVKIYDDKDKLVKETKSNMGGMWQCLLPPGKYVAEISGKYKGTDIVPQNLTFEVKPDATELYLNKEVS